MKRIVVATFFGLVAGGICSLLSFGTMGVKFAAVTLLWILLNRTVMGFAIGISGLRLHWALHGIVVGVVIGSIFSYFTYMDWGVGWKAWLTLIGNALFGLMIEFFTTKVFRAPVRTLGTQDVKRMATA